MCPYQYEPQGAAKLATDITSVSASVPKPYSVL